MRYDRLDPAIASSPVTQFTWVQDVEIPTDYLQYHGHKKQPLEQDVKDLYAATQFALNIAAQVETMLEVSEQPRFHNLTAVSGRPRMQ